MNKFSLFVVSMKTIQRCILSLLVLSMIFGVNYIFFYNMDFGESIYSNIPGISDGAFGESTHTEGKLAIIIDDFGQSRAGVKEMMSIDRHLTFAVMPFLSFSQSDAENAYQKNHEVIVHLPMESYNGKLSWVGPKPILSVLSDQEIQSLVIEAFDNVPHAVGANIHMGAKAGEDERVISDVLDIIKLKNVYFVDSRAARHPVAKKIADEKGILCYDRDVFIDGKKSKEFILKELKRAGDLSLKKGFAIAIGHVGTEGGKMTAEAIKEMLPYFDRNNIQLVYVSEIGKQ
ncbi:MAG: divergent polysaccharide deacetylase family protein [Clostridia bacterium]|nr:divergent polysaccharide deacetylase family protein [Clostridia bacterium]